MIDKDLATARLAITLFPHLFVIVTDVPQAYTHFGTAQQKVLNSLTPKEADQLNSEGQFGVGSMQPKIAACAMFVRETGKTALITNLAQIATALTDANVGTRFVPDTVQ